MTELMCSPKIKPEHLARKAIVYLRQSSEKQAGQDSKARRGELFKRLPAGFARDLMGKVVFDPDQTDRLSNASAHGRGLTHPNINKLLHDLHDLAP
jgi:hypothetical protein